MLHAAEQHRPDVAPRRDRWRSQTAPRLDVRKLVFLDQTWAKTNMTRTHGYAPTGQRLRADAPHGHWQTTTFVGALRVSGFIAPVVIDGAIRGERFCAYVEQALVPELRRGDVVVMDNRGRHTVAGVRRAIEGAGCELLYLPPYRPDLNPIENAFSKLKRLSRSAAERTVEALWNRIGQLLDRFRPDECRNYLRHCGYSYNATRT